MEGDLHFAVVEDLQEILEDILETHPKVLILRFRRTHLLASTGIIALNQIIQSAKKKGIVVLFSGVHSEILETLESAGIVTKIGQSNIFTADNQLLESTQMALEEAKRLIQFDQTNSLKDEEENYAKP